MSEYEQPDAETGAIPFHAPPGAPIWNLNGIVSELKLSREVTHNIRPRGTLHQPPSRDALERVVRLLSATMFPTHYGRTELGPENIDYYVGSTLNSALVLLVEQIHRGLSFSGDERSHEAIQRNALAIARDFASDLPAIRGLLVGDLRAAFDGDPAANNYPEILLGYPGMTAIIHHRLAHSLYGLGATLVARLIADIVHSKTGIDIHPAADIGPSFFIDHGTGVVIGETTVIGERVRLYQAVTLGARHFPTDAEGAIIKGAPRHPVIEDDVVIYAGATILGRITVGKGSTIGGNVWITRDVPPGTRISQAKEQRE